VRQVRALEIKNRGAFKSAAVILLLTCAVFVSGIVPGAIKSARAYSIPNTSGVVWESTITTSVGILIANAGDLIVANIQLYDANTVIPGYTSIAVVSVGDNRSNTYHRGIILQQPNDGSPCGDGSFGSTVCYDDEIWYAIAATSGTSELTVQITNASYPDRYSIEVMDVVAPPGITPIAQAYGGAGSGDVFSVTPISVAGGFPVASVTTECIDAGFSFSAGTDYIALPPPPVEFNGGAGATIYGNPATFPSSPSDFPAACTASFHWMEVALVFATQTYVTQVVPCTAFQLQCWLYPMFVFGVYMILVTGMARIGRVPSSDLTGHLLEAFSLAALLCVIFGILNVMFPLIITVVQVIRAVRK
jgi:hypothetical protein